MKLTKHGSGEAFRTHVSVDGHVVVRGAREHNLKDVDLTIPRNALVVFTGVSGSIRMPMLRLQ